MVTLLTADEMRLFSRQRSDELFEFSFLQGVTSVLFAFFVALIVMFATNLMVAAITFLSVVALQYVFFGQCTNNVGKPYMIAYIMIFF